MLLLPQNDDVMKKKKKTWIHLFADDVTVNISSK